MYVGVTKKGICLTTGKKRRNFVVYKTFLITVTRDEGVTVGTKDRKRDGSASECL